MICFNIDSKCIKDILPKFSGIYKIYNIITNQIYYGSTTNIRKRFIDHKNSLTNKRHSNALLQNSYNKYKNNSFYFEILETCEKEHLLTVEQKYLDMSQNFNSYNICKIAGNTCGIKMPENCKNILRKVNMTRTAWNKSDKEKTYLNEHRKKISETLRKTLAGSKTKLNWELVREIRQKYKDNYGILSTRDLAKLYNVDCSQISRIINNKTWKEIENVINQ
jgi:group I intron endonuclease